MDRRKFLLGTGALAAGGAATLGSGAFSRVESQRDITVQVAEDPDAYLGLSGTGSQNSENYVSIDDDGHLAIDIGEHDDFDGPETQPGEGVNSDSITWFDSMVQVCNQGKEAVGFYIEPPEDETFPENVDAEHDGEPRLQFYTGEAAQTGDDGTTSVMGEESAVVIPLGECIELGVRTYTQGVDATAQDQLFGDEITLVADVDVNPAFGEPPDQDPVENTRTGETFAAVQPAIDAAQAGDRVQVLTNTQFTENVDIDKPGLTLEATDNHKPLIEGRVAVSADGVTVDGFEVSPPPAQNTFQSEAIRVSGTSSGVTIENNTVDGFERDDAGGSFYGVDGINVFGGDADTPIENATIVNNEVRNLRNEDRGGVAGISIQGNVDGVTVETNSLSGLGKGVTAYGFGVTVRGTGNHGKVPRNVDVENNGIDDVRSDGGDFLGVGLGVEAAGSNYRFENNDIDSAELGVEIKTAAGETSLRENTFSRTDIHLADVTGAVGLSDALDDNDFGTAAATDDVVPNSLRPSGFDPYRQVIFPSIQPAIDISAAGARTTVAEGTYDESVEIDVEDLTLRSTQGPGQTTIGRGVSVRASGATVDGFEIRNPGTQGSADPGSPGGVVGVRVTSGNQEVSVRNNVITEVGTGDDDANPIGVLASDDTSDITVENNEISTLEGTDEDQGQVQGVLINESGTPITDATVNGNTITGLVDTRSTNAIRFNGDVTGEINGNVISDLNTEGTIPGSGGDPGGFTQVIALQQGGGSTTGPSNVTIRDNSISDIETTTPDNFAPPFHVILGGSTDGTTVTIDANDFSGDSQDDEVYVGDGTGELDLTAVVANNSFTPAGNIDGASNSIVRL